MFFPPDTDDHMEMRFVVAMVSAGARANEWVFFSLLFLLMCYVVLRLIIAGTRALIAIYKKRVAPNSPHAHTFRILYGVGAVVPLGGLALVSQPETRLDGIYTLCNGFAIMTLLIVGYNWYLDWQTPEEEPVVGELSLDEIVAMQNQVNAAHDLAKKA